VNGDRRTIALAGEVNARQILQNLIGNAIKYSSPDQPVEVNITEEQGMAVVRVLDRGPGIDESEVAAIFEPFYRSERTVSVTGMGIGLSVCARLVTAMGGAIWCQNRADGGCEFGFRLPLAVVEDVVEPEEGLQAIPVPA
jgi:signal transduction histidine kinase